jgi:histidinol-phosphate aminotransferase
VTPVTIRPAVLAVRPSTPHRPIAVLARELGLPRVVKLGANEDAGGPLPAALEAYTAVAGLIGRYPDSRATELVEALAAEHRVAPACVLVGNGADELIRMAAALVLDPGDRAVIPWPSFPSYRDSTQCCGAEAITVDAEDPALAAHVVAAAHAPGVRLVYLANPNNPTGRLLAAGEIRQIAQGLPGGVLCVVDEAYYDYTTGHASAVALVRDGAPNVCVLRTFSKIHALAGLRVGYAVGPPHVITALERIRLVFNVGVAAQVAAQAALQEREAVALRAIYTRQAKRELSASLKRAGLVTRASAANFVFARVPGGDGAAYADRLLRCGVAVRALAGFGAPDAIRVTVGTAAELDFLDAALDQLRSTA